MAIRMPNSFYSACFNGVQNIYLSIECVRERDGRALYRKKNSILMNKKLIF